MALRVGLPLCVSLAVAEATGSAQCQRGGSCMATSAGNALLQTSHENRQTRLGSEVLTGMMTMWSDSSSTIVGGSCEYANSAVGGLSASSASSPYVARRAYCAADAALYQAGATCGSCFRVSYDGSAATDAGQAGSLVVQIVDSGSAKTFDCQVDAFHAITGARTGVFPITYELVECETNGPALATVLDGNNAWYTKVIFSNLAGAVIGAQAVVDGQEFSMNRVSGATWSASPGGAKGVAGFVLTLADGSTVDLRSCFASWPVATGTSCSQTGLAPMPAPLTEPTPVPAPEPTSAPTLATTAATPKPTAAPSPTAAPISSPTPAPTPAPSVTAPPSGLRGQMTMWSDSPTTIVGGSCEYASSAQGGVQAPSATSPYVASRAYCAADAALYQAGATCGSCFRVSYDGSRATDAGQPGSLVVQIVDSGSAKTFDCQVDAFRAITGATTGVFPITYEPVECEMDGLAVATVLDGNNAWYTKVIFSNLPGAVQSAKAHVDGKEFAMNRVSGATWSASPGGARGTAGFVVTLADGSVVDMRACFDSWPVATGSSCLQSSASLASPESPAPSPAPVPMPVPPSQCSPTGQDCRSTGCCSDSSLTCFEKDQYWASCRQECTPSAVNPNDPEQYQTPWSCNAIIVA